MYNVGITLERIDITLTPEDMIKLDNQLCFPIYVCSREISKAYYPVLSEIDLTYTQYLTMMALWENNEMSVKELCQRLYLDSGTLTPLLKKMENKGLLTRKRSTQDERSVIITISEDGMKLKEKALSVPQKMACKSNLTAEEFATLQRLLHKLIHDIHD